MLISFISSTNCFNFGFRLILIAEKDKVYEEFPTPLINRLEKHFVVTSTVLTDAQKELLKDLEAWAKEYACIGLVSIRDVLYREHVICLCCIYVHNYIDTHLVNSW